MSNPTTVSWVVTEDTKARVRDKGLITIAAARISEFPCTDYQSPSSHRAIEKSIR